MRIKTNELKGAALDWAVAEVSGANLEIIDMPSGPYIGLKGRTPDGFPTHYSPSTLWGHGGPLISEYAMEIENTGLPGEIVDCTAYAWKPDGRHACAFGDTELVAICRAAVWLEIGDEVDVPEELL